LLAVGLLLSACGDATSTPAASTTKTATQAPSASNEVAALKNLDAQLTATGEALKKNDVEAAKTAYKKFDDGWYDVEDSVRGRSKDLYREIEDAMTKVGRELLRNEKPVVGEIVPALETLQQKYATAIKTVESSAASTSATKAPAISGADVTAATAKVSEYLKGKADSLVKTTGDFAAAVKSRDLAKAKAGYETARFDYESVEFLAEAFSEFDVAIDARPDDFPQGENDLNWTGFHPLEKAIYSDGKLDERTDQLADKLVTDVTALRDEIQKMTIDSAVAINGAAELIEEIQAGKITGEEERYSHTDLNDFRANLQSAKFVYTTFGPFMQQRNPVLDTDLKERFDEVEKSIAPYFNAQGQATDYKKVDDATRKALAQKVEALADSFSRVAGTLGLKV
jgi:iron uptake system component EfeO